MGSIPAGDMTASGSLRRQRVLNGDRSIVDPPDDCVDTSSETGVIDAASSSGNAMERDRPSGDRPEFVAIEDTATVDLSLRTRLRAISATAQ